MKEALVTKSVVCPLPAVTDCQPRKSELLLPRFNLLYKKPVDHRWRLAVFAGGLMM